MIIINMLRLVLGDYGYIQSMALHRLEAHILEIEFPMFTRKLIDRLRNTFLFYI